MLTDRLRQALHQARDGRLSPFGGCHTRVLAHLREKGIGGIETHAWVP
jgi:hypothetical protein